MSKAKQQNSRQYGWVLVLLSCFILKTPAFVIAQTPPQNDEGIQREARRIIVLQTSRSNANNKIPPAGGAQPTSSQSSERLQREAQHMILELSRFSFNPASLQEAEERQTINETRQTAKEQILNTPTPEPTPNLLLLVSLNRQARITQEQDEENKKRRRHFDDFQKARYRPMTYNGSRIDYTSSHKNYQSITRR